MKADYVIWRDSVVEQTPGPGRGKKGVSVERHLLPQTDLGRKTAHKWRKALVDASARDEVHCEA